MSLERDTGGAMGRAYLPLPRLLPFLLLPSSGLLVTSFSRRLKLTPDEVAIVKRVLDWRRSTDWPDSPAWINPEDGTVTAAAAFGSSWLRRRCADFHTLRVTANRTGRDRRT